MWRARHALEALERRLLLAADLQPALFGGWSDVIVISAVTGTNTDAAQFPTGTTVRVDWGVGNFGNNPTSGTFSNQLKLDGVVVSTVNRTTNLAPGFGFSVLDTALPALSTGVHTLQVVLDSGNTIAENSETNNTYSRKFYYGPAANGEIRGKKWDDANANGVREPGEPLLSGWSIYVDVNNNNVLDAGDISDVTDAAGNYELLNVPPGLHQVREVPAAPGTQTLPGPAGKSNNDFKITVDILGGLTASQQAVFAAAAARWAQIIKNDLPDLFHVGFFIDDVRISAQGTAIDGVGGILGSAGPTILRPTTFFPAAGVMQFDSADLADLEADGQLDEVILHEMGHVLGIGTIWTNKGLLTGAGGANPRFTGANATAQFNALFNPDQASVPVENTGGSGTRDSHWRESVLENELMTGFLDGGVANPISVITVGGLADLGYTVDYAAADPYTAPGPSARTLGGEPAPAGRWIETERVKHRVMTPKESRAAMLRVQVNVIASNEWEVHVDAGEVVQNIDFGTDIAETLPSWVAPGSAATWNAGTSTLTVTGSAGIIANPGPDAPLIVGSTPAANLTINPSSGAQINVGGISLSNGARVTVTDAASDRVLIVNAGGLNVTGTAALDMTDNDLIIDYSGASPIADIEALVRSGFNGGDWQGGGITSSAAALDGNFVLAVADNATLFSPFGSAEGGPPFAGVDVDLTCVLVKFTHRVDLDLDGLITGNDAAVFNGFFSEGQPASWQFGDVDYDGVYSGNDAAFFNGFYNESLPPV